MATLETLVETSGQKQSTALRLSGLRPGERRQLKRWSGSLPAFYQVVEGLLADYDTAVAKTTRTTERLPYTSHEFRAQIHYLSATAPVRAAEAKNGAENKALDALAMFVIRHHDTPEELTRLTLKANPAKDKESVQRGHATAFSYAALDTMERTLKAMGVPEERLEEELRKQYLGIDVHAVLEEVMKKLTPGNKTPEFSTATYIDTLRNGLQTGSSESKYLFALAKVAGDRPHNSDTLYADLKSLQKAVSMAAVHRQYNRLGKAAASSMASYRREKSKVESEFVRENAKVRMLERGIRKKDPEEKYASVKPHARIMELYKTFLTVNETLRYLEETDSNKSHHTGALGALRLRLIHGLEHLLKRQQEVGHQEALVRAVYFPLDTTGSVWESTIAPALYKEISEAATLYTKSAMAQGLQTREGKTKADVFNGTIKRLTIVEKKDEDDQVLIEAYEKDYLRQMQDACIFEAYANVLLPELEKYTVKLYASRGSDETPTFRHFTRIRTSMSEALEGRIR